METYKVIAAAVTLSSLSTPVSAICERNVDKVAVHYINGMFTEWAAFQSNREAIEVFMAAHFETGPFEYSITGTYNFNEPVMEQVLQVARHKLQDANASMRLAIMQLFNNDPEWAADPESVTVVQDFLADISGAYQVIHAEHDSREARAALVGLLDSCARVVLMTHSQGNFYGNMLFNDLYTTYVFPSGYQLVQYPMLGTIQIASPVYVPGGAAGTGLPQIVGHLTNNNDIIMSAVRSRFGSVDANYNAPFNWGDVTGHNLDASYLRPAGQSYEIAQDIRRIISNLRPYPLHAQYAASSTAIQGYGYSSINQYLDIQFTSGEVYRYSKVVDDVFEGLQGASSKGGYFNTTVRNAYPYEALE